MGQPPCPGGQLWGLRPHLPQSDSEPPAALRPCQFPPHGHPLVLMLPFCASTPCAPGLLRSGGRLKPVSHTRHSQLGTLSLQKIQLPWDRASWPAGTWFCLCASGSLPSSQNASPCYQDLGSLPPPFTRAASPSPLGPCSHRASSTHAHHVPLQGGCLLLFCVCCLRPSCRAPVPAGSEGRPTAVPQHRVPVSEDWGWCRGSLTAISPCHLPRGRVVAGILPVTWELWSPWQH